jgi:hypothetical protein
MRAYSRAGDPDAAQTGDQLSEPLGSFVAFCRDVSTLLAPKVPKGSSSMRFAGRSYVR